MKPPALRYWVQAVFFSAMRFKKKAQTLEQHLQLLKDRGLHIADDANALHYLRYVGYYRLTGYCLPFQDNSDGTHRFQETATFEKIKDLYGFDRQLRLLILDAIERIEVAFRAAISDTLSLEHGPHWYLDPGHFGKRYGSKKRARYEHDKLLAEIDNADDVPFRHYREKYHAPPRPPSWMAIHALSFGACSRMFAHLKKRQIHAVSQNFQIEPTLLASWMHGLSHLRNLCAHHSRVWNRNFVFRLSKYGTIPEELAEPLLNNNKFYAYAAVIKYFLNQVNPTTSWAEKLAKLLDDYPFVHIGQMGFPDHWRENPLWPPS